MESKPQQLSIKEQINILLSNISQLSKKQLKISEMQINKINFSYKQKTTDKITLNLDLLSEILAYEATDYNLQKIAGMIQVYQIIQDQLNNGVSPLNIQFYKDYQMNQRFIDVHSDKDLLQQIQQYDTQLQQYNFGFDYFAVKTLQNGYLFKHGDIYETPLQMFIRVSIELAAEQNTEHLDNSLSIKSIYNNIVSLSKKYFIHASPTLFNSGLLYNQLSSCYLVSAQEDSVDGIFNTLHQCAMISKHGGGLSLSISNIRAKDSVIKSTNGQSQGIPLMLRVFNESSRYVNQSSRRKGSIAIYLEPWHLDIEQYLQLKKNTGQEQDKCRDLFFAVYINDLFMKRVQTDSIWSLFCPDTVDLQNYYGEEFEQKYIQAENNKLYRKQIKARELFDEICKSQIETSLPYVVYKDQVNKACNQNNLGTIKQSNLCVHGDTELITRKGYSKISDLVDSPIDVWNGFEWTNVVPKKTGIVDQLYKITFDNGEQLLCTDYHKFWINFSKQSKTDYKKGNIELCAKDLKQNMKIMKFGFPVIVPKIEENIKYIDDLLNKKLEQNYDLVIDNKLLIESQDYHFLHDLKKRINCLGNDIKIHHNSFVNKFYTILSGQIIKNLEQFGLTNELIQSDKIDLQQHVCRYITIKNIETVSGFFDTFCFTDPKKNLGVFNRIVTGQCMHPDTELTTDQGYKKIGELQDKEITIWNGFEWSKVVVKKTGEDQQMMKVCFNNGEHVVCTEYHKFYIKNGNSCKEQLQNDVKHKSAIVEAKNLKPDMKLIKFNQPVVEFKQELKYAYTQGFFTGDGTYLTRETEKSRCKYQVLLGEQYCGRHIEKHRQEIEFQNKQNIQQNIEEEKNDGICQAISNQEQPLIDLYHNKIQLQQHMDFIKIDKELEQQNRQRIWLPCDIKEKSFVPIEYDIKSKMLWFAGLCDSDGCLVTNKGSSQSIQITSIDKELLMNVKKMLNLCGVDVKIKNSRSEQKRLLPDGKGGKKEYLCKQIYRMIVSHWNIQQLMKFGFKTHRLQLIYNAKQKSNSDRYIQVESVEYVQKSDTFCFTEPLKNLSLFNRIICGQCVEVTEFTSKDEIAVCNLASINLKKHLQQDYKNKLQLVSGLKIPKNSSDHKINKYIFEQLFDIALIQNNVEQIVNNLNIIIDRNYYPVEQSKYSNLKNRPIGIGIQGLQNLFFKLGISYESEQAIIINSFFQELIYFYSLQQSNKLAKDSISYGSFQGSQFSQGILQFDHYQNITEKLPLYFENSEYQQLKNDIKIHGTRNSLLTCVQPTQTVSQLLNNYESTEPQLSNIYSRRTLSGEFLIINKYLMKLLNQHYEPYVVVDIVQKIIEKNGSIDSIKEVTDICNKDLFKTIWQIKQKKLIDLTAQRQRFIDQSQSLNIFLEHPSIEHLRIIHMYTWQSKLKSGMYYLRQRNVSDATKFTLKVCQACQ